MSKEYTAEIEQPSGSNYVDLILRGQDKNVSIPFLSTTFRRCETTFTEEKRTYTSLDEMRVDIGRMGTRFEIKFAEATLLISSSIFGGLYLQNDDRLLTALLISTCLYTAKKLIEQGLDLRSRYTVAANKLWQYSNQTDSNSMDSTLTETHPTYPVSQNYLS